MRLAREQVLNAAAHQAKAEAILAATGEKDAVWAQAQATRALAHATLATIPDPVVSVDLRRSTAKIITTGEAIYGDASGADNLPQIISYQGAAVTPQPCGMPFTKDDRDALGWALKNSEGVDAGF